MYVMSEEERAERAKIKALHKAVRGDASHGPRYRCLAWGFVRGFKYRRIERSHRTQLVNTGTVFEHNLPVAFYLHKLLSKHLPNLAKNEVEVWLKDPMGAIPAPPPRPKKPYMHPVAVPYTHAE